MLLFLFTMLAATVPFPTKNIQIKSAHSVVGKHFSFNLSLVRFVLQIKVNEIVSVFEKQEK